MCVIPKHCDRHAERKQYELTTHLNPTELYALIELSERHGFSETSKAPPKQQVPTQPGRTVINGST